MERKYLLPLDTDTDKHISVRLKDGERVGFQDDVGDLYGTVSFAPKVLPGEEQYTHMFTHAAYESDMKDGVCVLVTEEAGKKLSEDEQYYRVISVTEIAEVANAIESARLAHDIDTMEEPEEEHLEI